jgi:hypothetical protein
MSEEKQKQSQTNTLELLKKRKGKKRQLSTHCQGQKWDLIFKD